MKDIKKAYRALQYVVYKRQYLIPQRPFPPPTILIKLHQALSQQNDNKSPIEISKQMKAILKDKDPLYQKVKQEFERETQQFKENKVIYEEKYIQPSKIYSKNRPLPYFVSKVFADYRARNQKVSLKQVIAKWKLLTEDEKISNNNEAQQQILKNIDKYNQFVRLHKIPKYSNLSGALIYLREAYAKKSEQRGQSDGKFILQKNKQFLDAFNALTPQAKQKYDTLAQEQKRKSSKQYYDFLQRWKLTPAELKTIKEICKKYESVRKIPSHISDISKIEKESESSESDSESSSDSTSDQSQEENKKK